MVEPVIHETPRLILRPHILTDFEDIVTLWSDPEVTRYTAGGKPSTREECWQRLLRYHGLWSALGFGYFMIIDKENGAFLGEAGLADFYREITPPLNNFAEAGWALMPSAWGKGYAAEAISAIFQWYMQTKSRRPIACIINPENTASVRLATKVGFILKAETIYKGSHCLMFERPI